VLKNVTVTLEEEALRWARREAAEKGTSVSKLVGRILEREMSTEGTRQEAWHRLKKLSDKGFRSGAGRGWNREEAHERR
jgi:hypothetical protein